ncbi:hypothetical protein BIW11_13336 [Tropilaelaps mercedesae]|uniref:DH domain-containing protein n=1 Tax=Tropilaelaps mercedesae TaxID=418985 RepID=A0A1V9X2X0_9ACAR|nr:hypothetical protein BIW11_13336 [Tropilaelaps mercedesae]
MCVAARVVAVLSVKESHESHSVARASSTSALSTAGGQWRSVSGPGARGAGASGQPCGTSLKEKEQRKVGSSVALAGSQRGRRGGLSTEDLNELAQVAECQGSWKNSKGRQALGRKAGLFATAYRTDKASQDKEDMRPLTELLNMYAQSGIPGITLGLRSYATGNDDENLLHLEDSWRHIVDSPETLDKQLQSQQEALWELLVTEASYIRTLKVVVELFLSTLCNLQKNGLLNDVHARNEVYAPHPVSVTRWPDLTEEKLSCFLQLISLPTSRIQANVDAFEADKHPRIASPTRQV